MTALSVEKIVASMVVDMRGMTCPSIHACPAASDATRPKTKEATRGSTLMTSIRHNSGANGAASKRGTSAVQNPSSEAACVDRRYRTLAIFS
jgi:hypothetical protein